MLFHLGAFWRLNELAYLPKLARISSVSGGSITAGLVGHRWKRLAFLNGKATQFHTEIVTTIRSLASRTIDAGAVVKGVSLPGHIGDQVVASFNRFLFEHATLQDLPATPRFVINATNVQSGALWRFSKPYMWDWRVGKVANPVTELAVAVAASSAFPPVLSPVRLRLKTSDFEPGTGVDLQKPPFTEDIFLTDGGVYDNLGLETAWKIYDTILVSDGGGQIAPDPEPHTDWVRHALRINDLIDNQVRSLRKRQVIGSFQSRRAERDLLGNSQPHRGLPGADRVALSRVAGSCVVRVSNTAGGRARPRTGTVDQLGVRDLRCRDARPCRPNRGCPSGISVSRRRALITVDGRDPLPLEQERAPDVSVPSQSHVSGPRRSRSIGCTPIS